MVRFLADVALSQAVANTDNDGADLALKRSLMRTTPRRGRSMTSSVDASQPPRTAHPNRQRRRIPEDGPLREDPSTTSPARPRPRMPPPRRSYSATDKEPERACPPPGRTTLLDLPAEVHFHLFDLLDPLDGVCLGLAHSRLYGIHRRKHGTVSLGSRYAGPNDMEWAWRGAGPLLPSPERRRQVYCRKCGVSRCELHRHLKDWMGEGREYCEIRRVYGRPAGREARPYCFMSSPKKQDRCGRHGGS
ncbi:F-box domain-containing protein [Ophiocordyceps camponoti-floridani]|uniref:F-box domain-containing protein n=1 Tax=Ophiocordyceps camponoti-floridani TaxID=2030778 RepID=A0A8H4VEZ5_9HYPO|nr:F-box domain-containing protein [Ophiocordyceps camponoti-floridani]